jgi:hypothetical protein
MQKKRFQLSTGLVHEIIMTAWFFLSCGPVATGQEQQQVLNKRMAGYHFSVVFTGEAMPSSALLTYPEKYFDYQNYNFLVKFMPCLWVNGKIIYPSACHPVRVEDFPGGVEASFSYGDTRITTRITPLLIGRASDSWKGAALYEVHTSPAREVIVLLGKGSTLNLYSEFATSFMNKDSVIAIDRAKRISDRQIAFRSGRDNMHVLVKGSESIRVGELDKKTNQTYIRMPKGSGYAMAFFTDNESDLAELGKSEAATERKKVKGYYEDLYRTSLETPEPVMNQAFASALYNLEYSWLEPFGWGECLHHWLALWHMQVGAAADLIGQTGRSRSCIMEHARHLLKSGAVPQFMPNGATKRDFGGSNQYWVWQVRHYLNYTGDKDFARQVIPYVDTVINQTLHEYDPDGDYLASWGLQIGNQEDFLGNPYNGSVPSIELYNMFMTRAELSEILGDSLVSNQWLAKADLVHNRLRKDLWLNDLGRFAYYKDPTGTIMPDGQYETYLYPILYDIVDEYDQYSGLRHLRDRLTGDNGAVFLSNNFPWHATGIACTWGMQCGEAQQPWAAQGLSISGLNNETWKPLKAMADWAQDINHRGSWPETAPEPTPAYFTPPAGLYLVAVTEALFGIRVQAPKGYVEISPSLPDHWPQAKLNLPDFQVSYTRSQNNIHYAINSSGRLPLKVKWQLPVSRILKCTVNNREAAYTVVPGVNHITLCFDAPASGKTSLHIEFEPESYTVNVPKSIAGGENLKCSVTGATINQIVDRSGILSNLRMTSPTSFSGVVQTGLLDPYRAFNQLGLLNFSRRTFFMDCTTADGIPFIAAADMNILPRFEAASADPAGQMTGTNTVHFNLRNNTESPYRGTAEFMMDNKYLSIPISIASRSDQLVAIQIPAEIHPSAGDNLVTITMPGEDPLILHTELNIPGKKHNFVTIGLPMKDMMADTLWNTIRVMPGFPHIFFTFTNYGWPKPMWALKNTHEISVPQIPGLTFQLTGTHFIPVSHLSGKVSYKLNLDGKNCKKVYLLVLPFVDNHTMFSQVGRITAYSGKEIVYTRTLHYPGDVDYWVPDRNPTSFASFREPRPDRFELLPLLKPGMSDWIEGKPPAFPESKWWSNSLPVVTGSCLMNVIEINLNKPGKLDFLEFESLGAMPAFGIVAATVELSE